MLIVHVHVNVKPEAVEAFREATLENASQSIMEPGVARFDVVQEMGDPRHFVLVEADRTLGDAARHKETAHYQAWRDRVADMMAEPRKSTRYNSVFPSEREWG